LGPGLSQRDIERLARFYENHVDAQRQGGCQVDGAEANAWLRRKLAEYVLPEQVGLEFERVMHAVFKAEIAGP
jgi:hypothetical protein